MSWDCPIHGVVYWFSNTGQIDLGIQFTKPQSAEKAQEFAATFDGGPDLEYPAAPGPDLGRGGENNTYPQGGVNER